MHKIFKPILSVVVTEPINILRTGKNKKSKVWLPNKLFIISHAKWLTVKILVLACKLKLM